MNSNRLLFVGNLHNQWPSKELELLELPDEIKSIKSIHNGSSGTVFVDQQNNYWVVGSNYYQTLPANDVSTLTKVNFFTNNDIIIKNVYINPCGQSAFWISTNHEIYGSGRNDKAQLGIGHNITTNDKAQLVKFFNTIHDTVMDIQSATWYSLALCETNDNIVITIITSWIKSYHMYVAMDIINLMTIFCHVNKVYFAGKDRFGLMGKYSRKLKNYSWNCVDSLNDKHIVKIATGSFHSLFLDCNGGVWCSGQNIYGTLGLVHLHARMGIHVISYFVENEIIIKDIECGAHHNLALDINNNLYHWGSNYGNGTGTFRPQLIDHANDIKYFGCGYEHSYYITMNGSSYLFGLNKNNQCLCVESSDHQLAKKHNCIDNIVNGKIVSISLGKTNTKIVCA